MNPKKKFSLGIDLAQESFDFALAPEGGNPNRWRELPHAHLDLPPDSAEGIEAMAKWITGHCKLRQVTRVVVESTGNLSKRFVRALREAAILPEPCVLNPRRSKKYGESVGVVDKTDRIDSALLAVYGTANQPQPAATSASSTQEQLRELTRLRQSWVEDLTAQKNRMKEVLEPITRRLLAKAIRRDEDTIKELEMEIEKVVASDPVLAHQVESLKQIKGIKQVTATTLSAELGDLRLYERNQLVGRAGIFPKVHESGKRSKKPRLAKGGGGALRRVLYMCATSVLKSKSPLREYAERLKQRGMEHMEVLMALMRKLLLVARAVMKAGGHYEPAKIQHGARFS